MPGHKRGRVVFENSNVEDRDVPWRPSNKSESVLTSWLACPTARVVAGPWQLQPCETCGGNTPIATSVSRLGSLPKGRFGPTLSTCPPDAADCAPSSHAKSRPGPSAH